ncbi:MAG: chemotaxis protein CheX [Bdellovibrionales bacterium]|nr:chemotaxis protein CheX [Bdellovibrionales bacterium]
MNAAANVLPILLDESLLQDVIKSVTGVFREGFGIQVKCVSHQIGRNATISSDISGMVGLTQDRLEGNLILAFPEASLYAILSQVYAREFKAIDRIVKEGAAEMANMVYGHMKASLNERGHGLRMSLPNVVIGHNHAILSTDNSRSLIAAFEFDKNKFHVIVALHDVVGS